MTTYLISGSSGLLGSALSDAARAQGIHVARIVRASTPRTNGDVALDLERRWIDRDALDRLGAIDAVIHLAGAGIADRRWTPARKKEILESRTVFTELLSTTIASMATPPGVFLSGSAIGFYGDTGASPVDEAGAHGQDFLAEVCGAWEHAASNAGVRTVLLRTGIVLTPKGGALKKQLPLFKAGLGGRLGNGRQMMSWIGLADWIRSVEFIIATPSLSGPLNLTAPNPVSNGAFTRTLGRVLHRPAFAAVPPFALTIALGGELATTALLASQNVVPTALLRAGFTFTEPELGGALRAEIGR
jgi:uncharacterized protein